MSTQKIQYTLGLPTTITKLTIRHISDLGLEADQIRGGLNSDYPQGYSPGPQLNAIFRSNSCLCS